MVAGDLGTIRYRLMLGLLISRLAANQRARLKILLLVPLMPVRDRLPWTRPPLRIRVRYKGLDIDWQLGPKTDAEIMQEVLISGCYADAPVVDPRVVLDVGSHAGISLLHFRATYPSARLIGIEPNPATFPRLRANAAKLAAEVHQLALASHDGPAKLFLSDRPTLASLDDHGGEAVTVDGRTLDSLLGQLGIEEVDLLKIDIEGGEFAAFRGSKRLRDIRAMIGEFHDYGDPRGRDSLFGMLDDFDVEVRDDLGNHGTFVAVRHQPRAHAK